MGPQNIPYRYIYTWRIVEPRRHQKKKVPATRVFLVHDEVWQADIVVNAAVFDGPGVRSSDEATDPAWAHIETSRTRL